MNVAPVQVVATSKPDADPGLFQLRFDDERYLPFEGAGAISTWRIELRQADNAVDLSQLNDVVLTLAYTARNGGAALEAVARAEREKGLARGGIKPEAQHLRQPQAGRPRRVEDDRGDVGGPGSRSAASRSRADRFSGRYRDLDLRIERVTVVRARRGTVGADALKLRLDPRRAQGHRSRGSRPPGHSRGCYAPVARHRALRASGSLP